VAIVLAVVYAAIGREAEPATSTSGPALLAPLANLGPDDVVLTVQDQEPANIAGLGPRGVYVVSAQGDVVVKLSEALVRSALGATVEAWPDVELLAVDTEQDLAVFRLSHPTAYVVPHVAVVDLRTGATVELDPCESTVERLNVTPWCLEPATGPALLVDPVTGETVTLDKYTECVAAGERFGAAVVAVCSANVADRYLVTWNPATGARAAQALGLGQLVAPWIVDGKLYLNSSTTEGGQILVDAGGATVEIGGGPAGGVAQVGDQLLVYTGSDPWGAASSYGHALGLWSPATGEFTAIKGVQLGAGTTVSAVTILGQDSP
jgi:hypothetical protein